jgi:hypothetical protein
MKERHIDEVQAEYGRNIKPDKDGYYDIKTDDVYTLLAKNDIYIADNYKLQEVAEDIRHLWKNQKEMITSKSLDAYSTEENGLQFKHYLLCEEYLKDSNITKLSKELHISRPTIYEWLKRDDVQKYLKARKSEIEADTKQIYNDTFYACFDALRDIIQGDFGTSTTDRIKAIDVYLKNYVNIAKLKQDAGTTDDGKLNVNIQVVDADGKITSQDVAEWRKIRRY